MHAEDATGDRAVQPDVDVFDPDPLDAIESDDYDDPTPEEITDPNHPDYVELSQDRSPDATQDPTEKGQ
ncbi:MAG: hypothetical protein MOP51_2022 [Citricoccus sp.]|nr:hypothetical protein [Citricoccus sp. WCRC_4]